MDNNVLRSNKMHIQDRVECIKVWNKLKGDQRQRLVDFHFPGRECNSLTGREIQMVISKSK